MTKTRLKELQTEIARLQEIDNKTTERVAFKLELETLKKNHEQFVLENATPLDLDLFDKAYDKAYNALLEKYNSDTCERIYEDCECESIADCDCADGGMPFEAAHTNHDIVVPCSKELDMEWANESENIQ